jgi:hypothetical protein
MYSWIWGTYKSNITLDVYALLSLKVYIFYHYQIFFHQPIPIEHGTYSNYINENNLERSF